MDAAYIVAIVAIPCALVAALLAGYHHRSATYYTETKIVNA